MTAALEPTIKAPWRYRDNAPPMRPPSLKRKLGAVLVYLVGTAGVGAAILWPGDDQSLTVGAFKIPASPFTALAAAAAPEPGPPPAPTSNQLAAVTPRALPKPAAGLLTRQTAHDSAPQSSAVQPARAAVVTPDTRAQARDVPQVAEPQPTPPAPAEATTATPPGSQTTPNPTTPDPTAPDQPAARHRPQRPDTNPDGGREHQSKNHARNTETADPPPNAAPQPDPAPGSTPKTGSDAVST